MKFNKLLIVSTFVTTSFGAEIKHARAGVGNPDFKGNWTETFETPYGQLVHSPQGLSFGGLNVGTDIFIPAGKDYFGYKFQESLHLKTDSTKDEFVAAMNKLTPPSQMDSKVRSKKSSSKKKKSDKSKR